MLRGFVGPDESVGFCIAADVDYGGLEGEVVDY